MGIQKLKTISAQCVLMIGIIALSACSKKGSSSSRNSLSTGNSNSSSPITLSISEPETETWVSSQSNSASFVITGVCTESDQSKLENSIVTITKDTTTLGSASCIGGTFGVMIDTTGLSEGSHSIKANVTDSTGVSASSESITLKKDVTVPQLDQVTGPTLSSVDASTTTTFTVSFVDSNLGSLSNSLIAASISFTGDHSGCRASVTGSGASRAVNITNCNGNGTVGISINGALLHDSAGNPMTVVSGPYSTFSVSNTGPSIGLSSPANHGWINAATNGASYQVQGTCSVNNGSVSIDVDSGDLTATATCNGSTFSGTIDSTSLSAGAHTVTVSLTDNGITATSTSDFQVDVTAPTVTISAPRIGSVSSSGNNTFVLTFEDLNGIQLSGSTINNAITINNGSCTKSTAVIGSLKALVTLSGCTGNSTATMTVGSGAWSDLAGNPVTAATSNSFAVDNTAPTIAITSPVNNSYIGPANDSANFAVSGTCSESSRVVYLQIDEGDFNSFASCGVGNTFSGTINTTGFALGQHTVVAKITDSAGNTTSSSTVTITKVSSQATVVLATSVNPTVKSSAIQVTATFDVDVTGFDVSDVTITGGSVSQFSGSGKNYVFEVAPSSPTTQTNIVISIPAAAGVDVDNNPSAAATDLTIAYYPSPSSVTGTSPGTGNAPEVTVGNGVSGLVAKIYSDSACTTLLGSSTMSASTVTITSDAIASSTTYYASFSDGTNESSCSSASFAYVLNSPRPTVSITSSNTSIPTTQAVIPMTVTFSTDVTGFTDSDLSVTNGAVSNFSSTSGSVYTFDFTPTNGGTGTFTIDVPENIAQDSGNHQNFASAQFSRTYYRDTPTVTRSPASTNDTTPDLTVGNLISGLTANLYSDGSCSSSLGSVATTGSTAVVTSSTISADTTYYADVTDAAGNKSSCSSGFALTFDTTAPANATSLAWTGGTTSSTTTLPITWVKSTDAGLANQKIQFHTGGGCSSAGSLIDLSSSTQQSYTYTAPTAGSFSFQIISVDAAGNSATSSCSGIMTVSLTTVSLTPGNFSYPAGQSLTVNFSASGGSGGNVFSVVSGPGTINSSTGVYAGGTSRTPGSTTVIQVADSASSTATVTITHTAMIVNGTVYTSVMDGTNMYLGGSFSLANYVPAKALVGVNNNSNEVLDYGIADGFNVGAVIKAVLVSNGFAFVGGTFTSYKGTTVQNLAKINLTTGALDTTFTQTTGPNNTVHALALNGSALYIGGSFNGYRGTSGNNYKYLLKLDSSTGALDTGFVPTFGTYSGNVYALHIANSSIYAGGDFAGTNGGTAGNTLIKADLATGASLQLYGSTSAPGAVYAITSVSGYLIIGGAMNKWMSSAGNIDATYQRLIKINWTTGRVETAFNVSNSYPNGTVRALAKSSDGTKLYVGGDFTTYRADAKGAYLAKVDISTGALDTTNFNNQASNSGPDNSVYALAATSDGSYLYVGGIFGAYRGSASGKRLVKVSASTGVMDTSGFHANGIVLDSAVNSIALSGSDVYAGGDFTGRGTSAQNLVKFDMTNWSVDTTFTQASGPNNMVKAIAVSGSNVYVGGDFTAYRGDSKGLRLVKLDSTSGNMDTASFNTTASSGPDGIVNAVIINNSDLYIGGNFTAYRGNNKGYRIAKLNATTGALDITNFNTIASGGPSATVHALVFNADKSKIYMGGAYSSYRSSGYCQYICVINSSNGAYDSTYLNSGSANGAVYAVALSGSSLYIGGIFTQFNASAKGYLLAKLSASTGQMDATFNSTNSAGPNAAVHSISVSPSGSSLYVGGAFTSYRGSTSGYYVAKVSATTGALDGTFNSAANTGPNGIVYSTLPTADGTKLYVGGAFNSYRGASDSGYFTTVSTTNGATSW